MKKEKMIPIAFKVSETVYNLLNVLALAEQCSVDAICARLADHAQQGIYRPGAWERHWLEQVFGDDWQEQLETGDPYGRTDEIGKMFQRPRASSHNADKDDHD